MRKTFLSAVCLLALAGCSGGSAGPLGLGALFGDKMLASAEPLFNKDQQKCLRDPTFMLGVFDDGETGADQCGAALKKIRTALSIEETTAAAVVATGGAANDGQTTGSSSPSTQLIGGVRYSEASRDEVIDALVSASNMKCGEYVGYLKSYDAGANSALSVASIVTGGLGGFIAGEDTARALSGTSGILSGSRAALNEIHFTNQTIHVLASAFEKARRQQRREITNRQACPISKYTLMRGIEDVMNYHGSCSIVTGLAEAARSVERAENPGIETMKQTLAELTALHRQANLFTEESGDVKVVNVSVPPASFDALFAARDKVTQMKAALSPVETELASREASRKARADELAAAQAALAAADAEADEGAQATVTTAQQALDAATKAAQDQAKVVEDARKLVNEAEQSLQEQLNLVSKQGGQVRAAAEAAATSGSNETAICPL